MNRKALADKVHSAILDVILIEVATGDAVSPIEAAAVAVAAAANVAAILTDEEDAIRNLAACLVVRAKCSKLEAHRAVGRVIEATQRARRREEDLGAELLAGRTKA